jgi:hypothetical protein
MVEKQTGRKRDGAARFVDRPAAKRVATAVVDVGLTLGARKGEV